MGVIDNFFYPKRLGEVYEINTIKNLQTIYIDLMKSLMRIAYTDQNKQFEE